MKNEERRNSFINCSLWNRVSCAKSFKHWLEFVCSAFFTSANNRSLANYPMSAIRLDALCFKWPMIILAVSRTITITAMIRNADEKKKNQNEARE